MTVPELRASIVDAPTQELIIKIRGKCTLSFEPPAAGAEGAPDPVATFLGAARLHMLNRSSVAPWLSDAQLLFQAADPANLERSYRLKLQNIDAGALRVLANLALAHIPDLVEMHTATFAEVTNPPPIDVSRVAYPQAFGPAPFQVDYEMPGRSSRERFFQLAFAGGPTDAQLQTIYSALEIWSQVPLMGGYAADGMMPWQSSVGAEPAFLLDKTTVEQAFPDLFLCDDDCYAGVVNWAQALHRSGCPLTSIVLR